jgi:hypothetical protein
VDAGSAAQAAFLVTQGTRTVSGVLTPQFQINGFSPFFFQSFPQYTGAVNVIENNDRSRYNALEVQFSRRFIRGLAFQVSYTLAKSEDTRSYDPAFAVANRGTAQSAANTPFNLNNRDYNYAPSDFDRRHSLQGYFAAELPCSRPRAATAARATWGASSWRAGGTSSSRRSSATCSSRRPRASWATRDATSSSAPNISSST